MAAGLAVSPLLPRSAPKVTKPRVVWVRPGESIRAALSLVADGGIVYLARGHHEILETVRA